MEVNSETDFVARNEWLQKLANGIAEVAVNVDNDDITVSQINSAKIAPLGADFRAPTVSEAVAEVISKVRSHSIYRYFVYN